MSVNLFSEEQEYDNNNEKTKYATKEGVKSYFTSVNVWKNILMLHHRSRNLLTSYYPPLSFNCCVLLSIP